MRKQIIIGILLSALVLPSAGVAQSPAPGGKCQAAVAPVSEALTQTSQKLADVINQIGAIETRVNQYYASVAVPAGQTVPNYEQIQAAVTKSGQSAVAETGQLASLELRCSPNAAASISRLNQEVAQAIGAVRTYRTAVRTELLAIRTRAELAKFTSPSPTVAPDPKVLP